MPRMIKTFLFNHFFWDQTWTGVIVTEQDGGSVYSRVYNAPLYNHEGCQNRWNIVIAVLK